MALLSQSIDRISEIDRRISQIDKKEPKNKFTDNMRSMMASLSRSIDKISEIDKKIMRIDKKEPENKFINNIRSMTVHYCNLLMKYQRQIRKYHKLH